MKQSILSELVKMSRSLGEPANDYVILGEGNTSAQIDDKSFWVKASGTQLRTVDESSFVEVSFASTQAILDGPDLDDAEIKQALVDAKVDPNYPAHPSVETAVHAACLSLQGVSFVGHTHPSAINMLTCSVGFEAAFGGRLFPDEVVVCGPAPVLIPYVDPGLPLARAIREGIDTYIDEYGELPKVLHLQNHGLFVLAPSAQQVENITAMMVKAARILLGAYALGGPKFMTQEAVERIHTRPDEHYRQKIIGSK